MQRSRRIIYNDDGDARYEDFYGSPPNDEADFLKRRFNWTIGTQVDSYFWCVGDGQEPPSGQSLPTAISRSPKAIPLLVGDDLSKVRATCQLCLATAPDCAPLTVSLNGHDVGAAQLAKDNFQEFNVLREAVRQGKNSVTVAVRSSQATQLRRLQLWVRV